jgi:ZIP family zinc transporter
VETARVAEAAFWTLVASGSLLVGAAIALLACPGQRVIGLVMAFGAGAMISAVAFELVADALETDDFYRVAVGIAGGSLAFFFGDVMINRLGGAHRKRSSGDQEGGSPLAIVLGATLDGVPESFIVGLSLVGGGGVSASFVVATFLSNLPESMAATTGLDAAGWPRARIWLLWCAVVAVSVLSGVLGYAVFRELSESTGAVVKGFAAGALLTMLADTMMPEAFEHAGRFVGVLTAAGFVVAVAIAGA